MAAIQRVRTVGYSRILVGIALLLALIAFLISVHVFGAKNGSEPWFLASFAVYLGSHLL